MSSTTLKTIAIATALTGGLLAAPVSIAAVDMFLKVPQIPGESLDKSHKNEIDVLAWSWGLWSGSATKKVTTGACVQGLSVTHYADAATPGLMMAVTMGQVLGPVTLTVRKSGAIPLEYIKIVMQDATVTSVSNGGSGGEDRLTENFTLDFSSAVFTYIKQNPDGTAGESSSAQIYSAGRGC
jgi:type VI secretion system secreted protein Hcp